MSEAIDENQEAPRTIALEGVGNVRDLGGIPVAGGRVVKEGLIYRGGTLMDITPADEQKLFGELGVSCVVDLRCGWERDAKPDPVVPGVVNLHIPFYDLEIVGIEYTEPAEGTKVVGRDVACNPDRFYRSLANPLTVGQMALGVNEILSSAAAGQPVYEHCSGGKDRAGIMALLLLTVLGASEGDILEDYLITNIFRDKNYDKMFARFFKFSGDEKRADELVTAHRARPENLVAFREAVDESYGSMDAFVQNQLGIDDTRRAEYTAACTR